MMFTRGEIRENMISRPQNKRIKQEVISSILLDAGIKRSISHIDEPHVWVMQSHRVYLTDGRCLLLKTGINPDWTDSSSILNQVKATELIRSAGIEQPKILSYSSDKEEYGFLYILSETQKGTRLCDVYKTASEYERKQLQKAVGQAYSLVHSIKNEWAGVWDSEPSRKKYPIHPSEFYRNAEIHNGSAKYLLENNIISTDLFQRICLAWDENLSYLTQRPNSLVHISPFPWSIYMIKIRNRYSVGGFNALGDFMWWDPMSDVAHLIYPPFLNIKKEEQNSFINEYNIPLDERAINLYTLLNRVCAMSGCYLAPVESEYAKVWIEEEIKTLNMILNRLGL